MEESIVRNIIEVLKSSNDKNVIYKALVKLRTDLVKDRDGIVAFRQCGGIPPVVRLLNRPYEKILEVALSILGNSCTDDESCIEALACKITPPLITILKSIPNPVVQCRACRLLGNLAKDHGKEMIETHSAAISQSICLILEENQEIPTTMMAARAVRFLLPNDTFLRDFVNNQGFSYLVNTLLKYMKNTPAEANDLAQKQLEEKKKVENVGRKMHQPREEYFKEVARHLEGVRSDIFDREMLKDEKKMNTVFKMPSDKQVLDLINEVLKCIQIASDMTRYVPIMSSYLDQHVFPCLVYCTEENSTFRSVALRSLSNFARNPATVFVLNSADAVTSVCSLATAKNLEKPLSNSEFHHCLSIICLLSGDACNRAKIRRSGALLHLLEGAKSYTNIKEISMILYALNNFQYDHISMDLLLRGGLVGILVKELDAFLNSNDSPRKDSREEKKESTRKRKNLYSCPTQNAKTSKVQIDIVGFDTPISPYSNNLSPASPSSSRSLSPLSFTSRNFYDHEEDDDDYSPVCSDIGETDEEAEKEVDENSDIMKMLVLSTKTESKMEESNSSDNEDEIESLKTSATECVSSNTIDLIDNLLLRITLQIKNRSDLSKPDTIKTIIKAIYVFGATNNNFSTSLGNIITDSAFFNIIVRQDTIHSIYLMSRNADLKSCGENLLDSLTTVAESGYGQGELAKLLTKGDAFTQKRASTAVSFVVKTPKMLYQQLTENGAIYTLINSILNKNDEIRFEAADGITALANSLRISIPKYDLSKFNSEKEFEEDMDIPSYGDDDGDDDLMKFILHRGCSQIPIKFDKKLLTENSDVFNSMLNSDFMESKNKEIHLKDYSVHGIKYFLNLMKLESEKKSTNIPPVYHFESILEAYELTRMYILESLQNKLFQMIVCRLNQTSILKVFEWSLKNYNPELSEIAINYYLSCSDITNSEKVELYREADLSTYSKEWNQMMVDAILLRCQNGQNVGNDMVMFG